MSTRTPPHPRIHALRLDLLALFFFALLVNGLAARFVPSPRYVDAYYYFGGAVQLARGRGFTEPYLWNYLDVDLTGLRALPRPSHVYWMPLTSIVAAPFLALGGADRPLPQLYPLAQIPFIILASALPPLSYLVAHLATGLRRHAAGAALLTLFSGFYFPFWTATDAFALFGLAAAGALVLVVLGLQQKSFRLLLVSGVCAGLAHLTRADGILVLPVILWAIFTGRRKQAALLLPSLLAIAGYLLVVLPWLLRNWLVVGSPLAPGAARALWLVQYDDLVSYPASTLTLARYLAAGWATIGQGKWWALTTNLGTLIAPVGNIAAFPFMLVGLWQLRRSALHRLAALYGLALFALMTLVFTFPGARGGFFHSSAALLPFLAPAAFVGLDAAVDATARVLTHWQPEKSKPIFGLLLVGCAVALTAILFKTRIIGADWRQPLAAQTDRVYGEIGQWLAGDTASIVVVNNPPGFYYFTDHPGIVVPNGDADTLLQAMHDFDARWLVLDVNRPVGLADLYAAPDTEPRLALRATFADNSGQPVYLFEPR